MDYSKILVHAPSYQHHTWGHLVDDNLENTFRFGIVHRNSDCSDRYGCKMRSQRLRAVARNDHDSVTTANTTMRADPTRHQHHLLKKLHVIPLQRPHPVFIPCKCSRTRARTPKI